LPLTRYPPETSLKRNRGEKFVKVKRPQKENI